jgi:hypothetical protein
MPGPQSKSLALAAVLALAGCSYGNNLLDWATAAPGSDGASNSSSGSSNTAIPIAPAAAESNPQPTIQTAAVPAPAGTTTFTGTTFVGQKAQQLRAELTQFQSNLSQHQQALAAQRQASANNASAYFSTIATINSRLQVGTTPGNPELVAQWSRAQSLLDQMNSDVAKLNTLANQVASDSSFGNYLLNEVRSAYNLQGGVETDRDQLHQIENQTLASLTGVDQLLNNLSQEINRQSSYVTNERNNLVTLSLAIQNGQLYGPSLANRSFATNPVPAAPSIGSASSLRETARPSAAAPAPSRSRAAAPSASDDRPLVVIRFDQPDVPYEQPLYTAVSRALERKPSATFTILAVAPNAGTPGQVAVNTNASRQNAENVLRALTNMGLPADRVSLSATMSPDVQSNEVRVFVR